MSRPDFRRGYLRVPLSVWMSVFCRALLTRRQFQLVSLVIRESWGWQTAGREPRTWTKPLASRDFARATGLSTDHLRRDLLALIERGVFREDRGRYQFISDPQLWKTLPPPTAGAALLTAAIPRPIRHSRAILSWLKQRKHKQR